MIKKTSTLLTICVITMGSSSFEKHAGDGARFAPSRPQIRTVVIDPGHGGFDPGTHGLISKEKNVALSISLRLGKALQQEFPELKIVYTRTTDIMPGNKPTLPEGIRYRAELANRSHGDLFLCIHCNSDGHDPGKYAVQRLLRYKTVGRGRRKRQVPVYATTWVKNTTVGTATYIWKADRNLPKGDAINQRQGLGENAKADNAAFDMTSPEAKMRAQLYEKKYFANSALLGTLVQNEFVRSGRRSEGVVQRQVGIGVLQATGMPSVLIETGYLTNKEEELYLNSKKGQNQIVNDIVNAFRQYKARLDGKQKHGEKQKH
ncbi:MAG: N-acetylmuramoyl-L-alanine amidase [Bacteroidetes bacterium]|nr:N-acetylmuramoyl-L-alanine amidase [Bacteroidota bacterium]